MAEIEDVEIIDVEAALASPPSAPSRRQRKEEQEEEEMTPAERERHERFLKAKEEGLRRAREDMQIVARDPAVFAQHPGRFKLGFTPDMLAERSLGSGPRNLTGRGPQKPIRPIQFADAGPAPKASSIGASSSRPSAALEDSASTALKSIVLYAPKNEDEEKAVAQERKQVLKRMNEWLLDANEEVLEVLLPVMKLPIVQLLLLDVHHESMSTRKDTRSIVGGYQCKKLLETLGRWIAKSGISAARELHDGYKRHLERLNRRRLLGEQVSPDELRVIDWLDKKMSEESLQQEGMTHVIEYSESFKQLGMVAFESENLGGALENWKNADEAMRLFKQLSTYASYNDKMQDLHAAILKNRALGCLRLTRWSEALDCASCAIDINDEDHKAWFRKACALESLGKIKEAGECLATVQQIADVRPDREKILKEVTAKKESMKALGWIDDDSSSGMATLPSLSNIPSPSKAVMKPEVAARTIHTFDYYERRRISKEEAKRLLQDLRSAYEDTEFQRAVLNLSREVRRDKVKFLAQLKQLTLPLQRPVLEHWQFEPTERGVQEMQLALGDHTRGANAKPELMEDAAATARALYGDMADVVFAPVSAPPPVRVEIPQGESESDDDMPPDLVEE